MAQAFDTELSKKLDPLVELAEQDVFRKLKAGVQACVPVAEKTGVQKFIRSVHACEEGTDAVIKLFDSMFQCVTNYSERLKKLEEALG